MKEGEDKLSGEDKSEKSGDPSVRKLEAALKVKEDKVKELEVSIIIIPCVSGIIITSSTHCVHSPDTAIASANYISRSQFASLALCSVFILKTCSIIMGVGLG